MERSRGVSDRAAEIGVASWRGYGVGLDLAGKSKWGRGVTLGVIRSASEVRVGVASCLLDDVLAWECGVLPQSLVMPVLPLSVRPGAS